MNFKEAEIGERSWGKQFNWVIKAWGKGRHRSAGFNLKKDAEEYSRFLKEKYPDWEIKGVDQEKLLGHQRHLGWETERHLERLTEARDFLLKPLVDIVKPLVNAALKIGGG